MHMGLILTNPESLRLVSIVKKEYRLIKSRSSKAHILRKEINRIGEVLRMSALCQTVAVGMKKYEVSPLDMSKVTCIVCKKLAVSEGGLVCQ